MPRAAFTGGCTVLPLYCLTGTGMFRAKTAPVNMDSRQATAVADAARPGGDAYTYGTRNFGTLRKPKPPAPTLTLGNIIHFVIAVFFLWPIFLIVAVIASLGDVVALVRATVEASISSTFWCGMWMKECCASPVLHREDPKLLQMRGARRAFGREAMKDWRAAAFALVGIGRSWSKVFGLGGLFMALEERVQRANADWRRYVIQSAPVGAAPADFPKQWAVMDELPRGGSSARLYVVRRRNEQGVVDQTGPLFVLKYFDLTAGGNLENIIRESQAAELAKRLGLIIESSLGNRAFWPGKASHRSAGRYYEATSKLVSSRPLPAIIVIVALMLPFSVYGLTQQVNYDFVAELPENIPSVKAYNLLREHMGGGSLFPLNVIVTGRQAGDVPAEMIRLAGELAALPGVTDIRSLNNPLGLNNPRIGSLMRVDGQLNMIVNLASEQGGSAGLQGAADAVGGLQRYMAALVERFPEIAGDPNYTTARSIVDGGLLVLALRQNDLLDAARGLAERFAAMDDALMMPPMGDGELFADLKPLADSYLAEGGTAYRIDVILDDPLGDEAQHTVQAMRSLIAGYRGGGEAVVSGFPAVITDMATIMSSDTLRAVVFILAGIFIVLLLMLRSVVAPLYLIATVLLSFTCTLGLTALFFQVVFGMERLSWMMPIFTFVMLVGLGIDYSIFLFGRIKEEVRAHGIREGVHVAVAATGAIITSAAVILAGTFAGMITGELAFLAQMGFAVSVGVLIDAFVVRTMLDPALAALFGKWTWWPGGVPQPQDKPARALTPAAAETRA
ncbi:hypothetical protein FBR01_09760 [Anaerolineae bacterium CFX8]|nr:hypothetical protein [Anaerolineae bacterium CFX8]